MSVKIPSFFGIPYSSGTNIMSSRDHPFNKSTRPLLMERKSQFLLKNKKSTDITKLNGFNDFNIMSQQYTNLNKQNVGYPYSSPPPSPTTITSTTQTLTTNSNSNSNLNDFIFSDNIINNYYKTSIPKPYPPSAVDEDNYYSSVLDCKKNLPLYQKQNQHQHQHQQHNHHQTNHLNSIQEIDINNSNGPFIFGIHSISSNNYKNDKNSTVINSTNRNYLTKNCNPVIINQSNSDTSSSSKDSEKESKFLVRCRKKSTKRNNKEKNFIKKNLPSIKCVVVGDGTVGKTNLILSYLENRFIFEHVPTASDIYNAEVMVNDSPVHVTLCDTAGQDTLDPLRELCYPDSNVFLLCFSVVKPETFYSIKTKWAPKFSKTKAALILVGTQADLRNDINVLRKLQIQGTKTVSFADAWDLASSIGAKYIETSSFTQEKVKDVFDAAIWEALAPSELPPSPPLWKRLFCLV